MYEIEKGIPLAKIVRHGKPSKYPWRTMEVGDSFFTPKIGNGLTSAVSKITGRKFSRRTVDGGVRIWRIA